MQRTYSATFSSVIRKLRHEDFAGAAQLLSTVDVDSMEKHTKALFKKLSEQIAQSGSDQVTSIRQLSEGGTLSPATLLSDLEKQAVEPGISIVSCCMNRNANLRSALKSWQVLDVDEIVIVDWSSNTPVVESIADMLEDRIRVIRVEDEPDWILTFAFNVGLRSARFEKIFKLDADITVSKDFLQQNDFKPGQYIRGYWKSAVDRGFPDQRFVNGSFGAYKEDLKKIGYYNEFIRSYGFDDSDLYYRLSVHGSLQQKFLNPDSIEHLEQEESERLKHQTVASGKFLGHFPATEFHNAKNKFLSRFYDRWGTWRLQDYTLDTLNKRIIVARRTTTPPPIADRVYRDARYYACVDLARSLDAALSNAFLEKRWLAELLLEQHDAGFSWETTNHLLDIANCNSFSAVPPGAYPSEILGGGGSEAFEENSPSLLVCRGPTARAVVQLDNEESVEILGVSGETLDGIRAYHAGLPLASRIEPVPEKTAKPRLLVTTVYDEGVTGRAEEIASCVAKNSTCFDAIAIFYERSDGSMKSRITTQTSRMKSTARFWWFDINQRPTFEELFDAADMFFPPSMVVVANSDVVFDDTIERLDAKDLQGKFLVLSRRESADGGFTPGAHIADEVGMPNTLSADAWIYASPRTERFRADFGVGTFNCDAYLNFHICKSSYRLYNPCLSINAVHVHNPLYNSSDQKKTVQATEIERTRQREEARYGENPVKGVQWCRWEDTSNNSASNQLVSWTRSQVAFRIDEKCSNMLEVIVLSVMCLRIGNRLPGGLGVRWMVAGEPTGKAFGLMLSMRAALGDERVLVVAENQLTSPEQSNKWQPADVNSQWIRDTYTQLQTRSRVILPRGPAEDSKSKRQAPAATLLVSDVDPSEAGTIETLLLLQNGDRKRIAETIRQASVHYRELIPFEDELEALDRLKATDESSDSRMHQVPDWSVSVKRSPRVSLVSSVFKAAAFFDGFLENVAAAAYASDAEIILVDAGSPQDEQRTFERFIRAHPKYRPYFRYVRLEKDPGLYEAWKVGIQESRGALVGNANCDDRRSPLQPALLASVLENHRDLAGAATAIRTTRVSNLDWYSLGADQIWWRPADTRTIDFESLYRVNERGLVLSRNMLHCMPIWRKELHERYGWFDEARYGTSADWAFWLKCTRAGEKFGFVDLALSMYLINDQSHNRTKDVNGQKELKIIEDFIGRKQDEFVQQ
jgi:glycosyltransferase involved in cell wall biosynthesis